MKETADPGEGPRSTIGVFGTGVMAHGIALICLHHGFDVVVVSGTAGRAEHLRDRLAHEAERDPTPAAVTCDEAGLARAELFVEATVEEAGAKQAALARVEPALAEEALIATTTSSLSVTALGASLRRPERFLGLHFFNPVSRMKLVEVVATVVTSDDALARGRAFVDRIGKRAVAVPDRAGFIVNRLMISYLNGATRLVEGGAATVEDVDQAMKLGLAHPLGPFALIDLVGADIVAAIGRSLYEETGEALHAPSPGLLRQVASGRLGRKAGGGYHRYPHKKR